MGGEHNNNIHPHQWSYGQRWNELLLGKIQGLWGGARSGSAQKLKASEHFYHPRMQRCVWFSRLLYDIQP